MFGHPNFPAEFGERRPSELCTVVIGNGQDNWKRSFHALPVSPFARGVGCWLC